MKKKELIETSIYMVTEYYLGNFEPFFEYISDDVLWIGPRGGQIIQGKESIIKAWTAEENDLSFSMGDIAAKSISTGRNNLEVILEYFVFTHFPGGETDKHHQRIHYSWGSRTVPESDGKKRVQKVCMIHISNIAGTVKKPGQIYATSSDDSKTDSVLNNMTVSGSSRIISSRGPDQVTYFFNSNQILFIESTDKGRHSIIHTVEGTYRAMERLRYFEDNFPGVLLRAHASYLVNPLYVRSLKRFEVLLSDGTTLTIPQKKYTAFRKLLENRIGEKA